MEQKDVIKDLAILTSLPVISLQKISNKIEDIISHDVQESYYEQEDICSLDIGIGTINILIGSNDLSYKFIPSARLEKSIVNAINSEQDILVDDLESALTEKIINTYKDLF